MGTTLFAIACCVIPLASASAIVWRVLHIISAGDAALIRKSPLRWLGMVAHLGGMVGGALLYLAWLATGHDDYSHTAGVLLLVSLAALQLFGRRNVCNPPP